MQNKLLNVFYNNRKVGRIAETQERLLAFEYDPGWLRSGFSISPFKLPLEKRVFIAPQDPFDGNFGGMNGEHATSIDGEGRNPTEEHCMAVAVKAGLEKRRTEKILNEVKIAVQGSLIYRQIGA